MMSVLIAFFSAVCSSGQSAFIKLCSGKQSTALLQLIRAGTAFLLFGILSAGKFLFHIPTLVFAGVYAVFMLVSMVCGFYALAGGPMSLTSLLCSYSLIVPCVFGAVWLKEKIAPLQFLGFVLLIASMFMISKKDNNLSFKKNWIWFVLTTFMCNGICSVVQKIHQLYYPGKYCNEFMVFAFGCILAVLVLFSLFKKQRFEINGFIFALLAGVCMGLGSYATLVLSASVDATVLFPVVSAVTMLLNFFVSVIVFKEKPGTTQIAGFVTGIISVVLIKL